jgi:hypothetical protein
MVQTLGPSVTALSAPSGSWQKIEKIEDDTVLKIGDMAAPVCHG